MKTYILKFIPWVCFLILGVITVWQVSKINSISFDPLGSKAAPYTFSGLLIILLFVDLVRNGLKSNKDDITPSTSEILSVVGVLFVSIIYCLAVFQLKIPFSIATILLVFIVAWLLQPVMSIKVLSMRLLFGALLGLGGELLFTKVFYVDLPTIW